MGNLRDFRRRFRFKPRNAGLVGTEREYFITNGSVIVPDAPRIIEGLMCQRANNGALYLPREYSYELSACQLESRVGPVLIEHLVHKLLDSERNLRRKERELGFERNHHEVGPYDMPLDVYPDPRYTEITRKMTEDELRAACRVIGTHVHIGMPNHDVALKVYNRVISHCPQLCAIGDNSDGERLKIYRIATPQCDPQPYRDWQHFYEMAVEHGWDTNPRNCWTLIRISIHGTIEFRMFGTTGSTKKVVEWAQCCHDLCRSAMN